MLFVRKQFAKRPKSKLTTAAAVAVGYRFQYI
jgi:hypothetical protein